MLQGAIDDLTKGFQSATSAGAAVAKIEQDVKDAESYVVGGAAAALTLQAISTIAVVIMAAVALKTHRS